MTDKQIIDGVDVSGCCHYNKKTGICSNGFRVDEIPYCNCFTCNYKRWKVTEKQLKAKAQECKELKEKLIKWLGKEGLRQSEKEFYKQQLDQLKAENEEYIKDIEYLKTIIKDFTQEVVKLKQTIAEIKEIAEPYNDMSGNCVILNCFEDMYKILQKISECEVGDANN